MVLKKTNIDLTVTNEELEYGLGFFMDIGRYNNSWSNNKKERFLNKHYLGRKTGEGEFYFEEKQLYRNISNSYLIGYKLQNHPGKNPELTVELKWKSLLLLSAAGLLPFLFFSFFFYKAGKQESSLFFVIWPVLIIIYALFYIINAFICYRSTVKSLKEIVGTRVKIREYHRLNPR